MHKSGWHQPLTHRWAHSCPSVAPFSVRFRRTLLFQWEPDRPSPRPQKIGGRSQRAGELSYRVCRQVQRLSAESSSVVNPRNLPSARQTALLPAAPPEPPAAGTV